MQSTGASFYPDLSVVCGKVESPRVELTSLGVSFPVDAVYATPLEA